MKKYKLSCKETHNKWNKDLPPLIKINRGDVVEIEVKRLPMSTVQDLEKPFIGHPLTGPIWINGAEPGDTLTVKILKVESGSGGSTFFRPSLGYLKEEFKETHLVTWKIDKKGGCAYSDSLRGIRIPLQPFCGVMGVASSEPGNHVTIPPRDSGGNMDVKYLIAGAILYLPVFVRGALFSVGDAHAAQGDGEVCGTAIETSAVVTLRFDFRKGYSIPAPRFETDEYYGVTGCGGTLDEAMKKALKYMIDFLVEEKRLRPKDAYILCSVAADFRICEVVDEPNLLISGLLPKNIFTKKHPI